ncbi:MAG TPA: phage tail tube protein [Xanthobacteraceae bacterium]|jgi:hypothetical protein|nr:phage tail tube protein [Xanthobacteraceae bacterium]
MAAQKGIGRLVQVGLGKESVRGTAVAATYWTPWNDLTIDEKKEFAVDAQSYGLIEDSTNLTQTKKWAQGSIAGNVLDQSFGLILYGMFGTLTSHSTHAGETVVYDNIFNIGESAQHQSLTFNLHDPLSAQDYQYANGVIEKLELNMALKQFINYTASLKALSGATHSAFTPSTTTENRFVPQYLTAKFANAYSTITGGGGTTVALKSAKVTFSANVEDQEVLGSLSPADFLNKEFSVEGTLEAIWQNESDFKTAFMGPTPQAMRLDIKNTDVTIGSATNPELILDFPKVTFQELGRPFKVKDLVYQTIKFKAVYSIGDTLMAKATLTNTVNGY